MLRSSRGEEGMTWEGEMRGKGWDVSPGLGRAGKERGRDGRLTDASRWT